MKIEISMCTPEMKYDICRRMLGSGQIVEVDQDGFHFNLDNKTSRWTIRLIQLTRNVCAWVGTISIWNRITLNSENGDLFHLPTVGVRHVTNTKHRHRIIPGRSCFLIDERVKWLGIAGSWINLIPRPNDSSNNASDTCRKWRTNVFVGKMMHHPQTL